MSRPVVESHYGAFIIRGQLVQVDYEFPQAAESVGWSLRRVQKRGSRTVHLSRAMHAARNCEHRGSDGTVACPDCGITASEFIEAAADFLSSVSI